MACAHPIPLHDKDTLEFIANIPCGRCVNCLVDWRSAYVDLCAEEHMQHNYFASYLTLTYDDYHLDWRDDWHGSLKPSLTRSDAQKFIKRVRDYMTRHNINSPFADPKFKYVVAGEYGEDTHRPHLHFILFGLDYRVCSKMFRECWKYGNIKLLPVKAGCFRYVVDYISKQLKTLNPHDTYDCYNLERPFLMHSKGLGRSLFIRQWDFITKHNYCYQTRKNKLRPLPQYYMRRARLYRYADNTEEYKTQWRTVFPNKSFSFKEFNKYKHELAVKREKSLIVQLRSKNIPVDDMVTSSRSPVYSAEYYSAFRQLMLQELVSNDDVVVALSTPNPQTMIQYKDYFSDSSGNFVRSSAFPSYVNFRQVAYDLNKYGDLLPF